MFGRGSGGARDYAGEDATGGKSHCHEITTKGRPEKPGRPFNVFTIRASQFLEFMALAALVAL